jgi:hypothetical protein
MTISRLFVIAAVFLLLYAAYLLIIGGAWVVPALVAIVCGVVAYFTDSGARYL